MADLEARAEYDELDRVLAARPPLKAPRSTRANVMALIATAPQLQFTVGPVARYAVPPVVYAAPLVLPDRPVIEVADEQQAERQQRRLLAGFIFTGIWSGACLLLVWLLWPAVSNLIFGPSADPGMQARLVVLQDLWGSLTHVVGNLVTANGPLVPTLLSAAVGIGLMLTLLYGPSSRRRNLSAG